METKNHKAFTLIELLIVIGIIGLLAVLAATSLAGARTRARDTRRIADLNSILKGLQLGHGQNGVYPTATPSTLGSGAASVLCALGSTVKWAADATAANCDSNRVYMGAVPADPGTGTYVYKTTDPANTFTVCATLEGSVNVSGATYSGSVYVDPTGTVRTTAGCP